METFLAIKYRDFALCPTSSSPDDGAEYRTLAGTIDVRQHDDDDGDDCDKNVVSAFSGTPFTVHLDILRRLNKDTSAMAAVRLMMLMVV
ncbi:hypothetical protein ZHAS_00011418 [Anopheles sinensis]|uniref:Uncharacterized protein n=1 Tax=Anopheles sinensis TaxID=74873 RepID=A0A084W0E4_ANOSI|nr:hypothetical protein ZHAS_00011418 [Anopheles sinensis]